MTTTPRHNTRRIRLRAATLAIAATGTLASLLGALVPTTDLDASQPFADLLGQWCTVVLLGCAVWGWLVTLVVLLEAVRAAEAGRVRAAGSRALPAGYRRLVLGACGLVLTTGAVSPALATPGPVHLVPPPVVATQPTQPSTAAVSPAAPAPPGSPHSPGIVVRPGDSLWHLAAERLPHDADNATIAHTWQRLYHANRDVIGTDPDVIEPGQRLSRPKAW